MIERSPGSEHYWNTLERILGDSALRIFLWRILVEDCKILQEDFPVNAQAYCLLAKQEIGKRLLADAKRVNAHAVLAAEKEYDELMELNLEFYKNKGEMNHE